jgi:hypothetical protein
MANGENIQEYVLGNEIDPEDLGAYGITYRKWYQDIANALRYLYNDDRKYYPPQMADAILALEAFMDNMKRLATSWLDAPDAPEISISVISRAESNGPIRGESIVIFHLPDPPEPIGAYAIAHLEGHDPLLATARVTFDIDSVPTPVETVSLVTEAYEDEE